MKLQQTLAELKRLGSEKNHDYPALKACTSPLARAMSRRDGARATVCAALTILALGCGGPTIAPSGTDEANEQPEPQGCSSQEAQPVDAEWTIVSGGLERTALVHVPSQYKPATPTPLVLNLHGYMGDAEQQRVVSAMDEKADAEGFLSIHPNGAGDPQSWNAGVCCGASEDDFVADDVQFMRDLLAEAEDRLCIDRSRIYVTGLSNGAFMAHRIACELSERVAAVAPVAGPKLDVACNPSRAVPIVHFHGDADSFVPYGGNPELGLPPVEQTMEEWARRNGCGTAKQEVFRSGDSSCASYVECPVGGDVVLCTVEGGGHNWPGGPTLPGLGKTTADLSATDFMWDFFADHTSQPRSE